MVSFNSSRDEKDGLSYILLQLQEKKRKLSSSSEIQNDVINEVIEKITDRLNEVSTLGKDTPDTDSDWNRDMLKLVIIGLSGINPDDRVFVDDESKKVDDFWRSSDTFTWGYWRLEKSQHLKDTEGNPLGYSPNGELKSTIVPPGGGATIHVYNSIPSVIAWNLTEIVQKNRSFLIGKAKVCEIDAICSVPALPEEISSTETATRVLNRDRAQNEWQRRVDAKRVMQIADFIDLPDNIVANSALLYAPKGNKAINTSNSQVVTIDFSKFLKKSSSGAILDHWIEDEDGEWEDLRPMWLIDGQHRTRGLASSVKGSQMEIPIILFTDEFSLNESAKVFAEINTLQKPLAPLHTLFMQHRFKIPTNGGTRDFQKWDDDDDKTFDSRQNNLAYECAAWLAANEGGPLYNRIRFLEANQPNFTIIKANSWVDYSRYWFKSSPYPPNCAASPGTIFQEVENYFTAFVNICNHNEWPEDDERSKRRWSLDSRNKGLLQKQSTSKVLLDIYGDVWEKASAKLHAERNNESPISVQTFEEILKPFYWVDWKDSDILDVYYGAGEPPRTALSIWMRAAIENGKSYPRKEVMSKNRKSKSGKGILSPPEDSPINIETSENLWPSSEKGGAVILSSVRPVHAMASARWTITDSDGREWGGNKTTAKIGAAATHKLKWEAWMENVNKIHIKVQWSNVNSPNAIGTETLFKKNKKSIQ